MESYTNHLTDKHIVEIQSCIKGVLDLYPDIIMLRIICNWMIL